MNPRIKIDNVGRFMLPKRVRDALRIHPGDILEIEAQEDRLIIFPIRVTAALAKEQGVWVYRSGAPADSSITDVIDRQRRLRTHELLDGRP